MKWSRYNILNLSKTGNTLLYNYFTDRVLVLLPELYSVVKELQHDIAGISRVHPEFYGALRENGFIVGDNMDEAAAAEEAIMKKLSSQDTLFLTVNPTLDCNLRCWYCYEKHTRNCYMTEETMERVVRFVEKETCKDDLNTIRLGFFGGEPLLKASQIALPLINRIKDVCTERNKKLVVHFTTNGVLLSERLSDQFAETGLEFYFQVPFDGGQSCHDKIKYTSNGNGTYRQVINNVKYALSKGFSFTIRCNYTAENIDSFMELVDDIGSMEEDNGGNVKFFLQKVWQEKNTDELREKSASIGSYIKEKGLVTAYGNESLPTHCYADLSSSLIINYNGDIFKCTARDFDRSRRIGTIEEDGNISKTENAKLYCIKNFCSKCRSCRLLPICTICVQNRIESSACCVLTDEEVESQLRMRLKIVAGEYD